MGEDFTKGVGIVVAVISLYILYKGVRHLLSLIK